MILYILLGITGSAFIIALLVYLKFGKSVKGDHTSIPGGDKMEPSIKEAEVGDYLTISGLSPLSQDYKDLVFQIERKNRYESEGDSWYELMGKVGDRTFWIEWEEDDEILISGTQMDKPMKVSDIGVSEEELARMDDEESDNNHVTYKGKKFYFDESSEVTYFKDNKNKGEDFYLWDFSSEDEEEIISVEKWEGEPFQVFLSFTIKTDHITVTKK
jgi:hypothetical protein